MDTVTLNRGETHIVMLRGLGSAGYQWSLQSADPQIVDVEELLYTRESVALPIAGSLDQRFKLTAIAPGNTLVRFVQSRRFAPAEKPNATFDVSLSITEEKTRFGL
jgi:predicted secreted protein